MLLNSCPGTAIHQISICTSDLISPISASNPIAILRFVGYFGCVKGEVMSCSCHTSVYCSQTTRTLYAVAWCVIKCMECGFKSSLVSSTSRKLWRNTGNDCCSVGNCGLFWTFITLTTFLNLSLNPLSSTLPPLTSKNCLCDLPGLGDRCRFVLLSIFAKNFIH